MKRLLVLSIWFPATLITLIISFSFYHYRYQLLKEKISKSEKIYQIATFLPRVLGLATDSTSQSVQYYLNRYQSPMRGTGESLVQAAREFEVDPFLILAIAQCETNLGKKSPEGCYNPFGLGIYGQKKICFTSWEESYQLMAKTLRKKYLDQGLTTPEQIMEKYCPVSLEEKDGHWAKCVNRFKKEAESINL
jgi:hypothetical protein